MFTPEDIIDYVQNSKKQAISKLVTNEAVAESLTKFVDAESAYTKAALKNVTEAATDLYVTGTKAVSDAVKKFDATKN